MLSHLRNTTLAFRDAFVQPAQFICVPSHGTHNELEKAALELIKLKSRGFQSTKPLRGDRLRSPAASRLLRGAPFSCVSIVPHKWNYDGNRSPQRYLFGCTDQGVLSDPQTPRTKSIGESAHKLA
jgi:hypothetical protein